MQFDGNNLVAQHDLSSANDPKPSDSLHEECRAGVKTADTVLDTFTQVNHQQQDEQVKTSTDTSEGLILASSRHDDES